MHTTFHLAFHVRDLDESRAFYGDLMGCQEGRSTTTWVDFDFFGHQISLHLGHPFNVTRTGTVGEHLVPMPHFGVLMHIAKWKELADKLVSRGVDFLIAPSIRFGGTPGEQATMFFQDPSGNPIEIKGFNDLNQTFAR